MITPVLIVAEVEFSAEGFELGDYVLASKYNDGDPGDHWAVGFYVGSFRDRHLVADSNGALYRYNGFRRMQHISPSRGAWMIEHIPDIDRTTFWTDEHERRRGKSIWSWVRTPMSHRVIKA